MIGLAAGTTLLTHGRIAGISGILNGLLQRRPDADTAWRACFIAGVVSGAASNKFLNPIEKDKLAAEFSLPFGAAQVGLAGTLETSPCQAPKCAATTCLDRICG